MERSDATVLLMGRGGKQYLDELKRMGLSSESRIFATGELSPEELAEHLAACDLVAQPYTNGVDSRRGSLMAAMAQGCAVATTEGRLTDDTWRRGAVALAQWDDQTAYADLVVRLLADESRRVALQAEARRLYRERFDLLHTVAAYRAALDDCTPEWAVA